MCVQVDVCVHAYMCVYVVQVNVCVHAYMCVRVRVVCVVCACV